MLALEKDADAGGVGGGCGAHGLLATQHGGHVVNPQQVGLQANLECQDAAGASKRQELAGPDHL